MPPQTNYMIFIQRNPLIKTVFDIKKKFHIRDIFYYNETMDQLKNSGKSKSFSFFVTAVLLLLVSTSSYAQSPIIMLPGQRDKKAEQQKPQEKPTVSERQRQTTPTAKPPARQQHRPQTHRHDTKTGSEVLLPLPSSIGKSGQSKAETRPQRQKTPTEDQFPRVPDEILIHSQDALDELLPSHSPQEQQSADEQAYPIFPKDTAAPIFMIMKTWDATNFSAKELLYHAVEMYGHDAAEKYYIAGVEDEEDFNVTLFEEDITLDELLDILSSKSGRDWGVDIQNRTIYFYPSDVDTSGASWW